MVIKKEDKSGKLKSGKSTILVKEKDKEVLLQLKQNPEGLRVTTLVKLTNLPSKTIYNILNKYEKRKLILNQYPIWKISNGGSDFWQTLPNNSNIFELHNLGYVVKLINKPDWWNNRKPVLRRLKEWQFSNHNFGKNNSNPYQQIINEDFVIQTYPESLIIIHRKRFYSDSPYTIIQEGILKTLEIIKYLEQKFRFNFFPSEIPCVELRANDYNRLKDYMAEKCKKEGTKFLVETEVGKCWVDYSEPFGKEANTPDIQETLEKHTKDLILNKPLLNSELQSLATKSALNIDNLSNQMKYYGENMVSHVKAVQQLGNNTEANSKSTELLADVVLQLKDQVKLLTEEMIKLKEKR